MPTQNEKQEALRREAAPLSPEHLTSAQRRAGERATRLLHEMARKPWKKRAPHPPGFGFLPIIDERRDNSVILIDGARGSGKSTLLLTLLHGYSRLLLPERGEPAKNPWFDVEDRIVPAGLIDLQPLPSSTNLLLLLTTALEKVVQALTPEHSSPEAPRWYEPSEEELPSRRAWRVFSRVAASGWYSNLPERKAALDLEAFAIEQEHEEYRRLDLTNAFHDFMDALLSDFQKRRGWTRPPLFFLAIDDADMNPALSGALLEILRKLYHPRLAFVITGHSELFIHMLELELSKTHSGAVISRPESTESPPVFATLAYEIYAKVVPQSARCEIPPLPPDQRVAAIPELEEQLKRFALLPYARMATEQPLTLRDYLTHGGQVMDALPDRLRQLLDLHGVLANIEVEEKERSTLHAVKAIWDFSAQMDMTAARTHRLEQLVHIEPDGSLSIEPGIRLSPVLHELYSIPLGENRRLIFKTPDKFEAWLVERGTDVQLSSRIAAAWMFTNSVAADDRRGIFAGLRPVPDMLTEPLFAHHEGDLPNIGRLQIAWPIPDWQSFEDIMEFGRLWRPAALMFSVRKIGSIPDRAARKFLNTVLRVGQGKRWAVQPMGDHSESDWSGIASELAKTSRAGEASPREFALIEWARSRAGLLAAPESGLPADAANHFLQALQTAFGTDWPFVKTALRRARREHLRVDSAVNDVSVDYLLTKIDELFPNHLFRVLVEDLPAAWKAQQDRLAGEFRETLRLIRVPLLAPIVSSGNEHLGSYLSSYRINWIEQTPTLVLQQMKRVLTPFLNIRGAGAPTLAALWRATISGTGNAAIESAVRVSGGKLDFDQGIREVLARIHGQESLDQLEFTVGNEGDFHAAIFAPATFSETVLPDVSAPAAEAVLRMAYDYSLDEQGHSGVIPLTSSIWNGVRFHFRGHSYSPWFFPPWPTLIEWEELEFTWNRVIAHAGQASSPDDSVLHSAVLDALGNWLMNAAHLLSIRQSLPENLSFALTEADWTRLTRKFWEKDGFNQAHEHAFTHWMERIPLMATPESGLSVSAANHLLSTLKKDSPQERAQMLQFRRARVIEAGIPMDEADSFLQKIDTAHPDHPWVQLFGPWAPLKVK